MMENLYNLKFLSKARADLSKIGEYYRNKAGDTVADKVMGHISEGIFILENHPKAGRFYRHYEQRRLTVYDGRYLVFYVLDEKRRQIKIGRIVSSKSDWVRKLKSYFRRRRSKFSSPQ